MSKQGTRLGIRGVNPKEKYGFRKAPLRLVSPALEIFVSVVQALGATKYAPFNWRAKPVSRVVYLEAIKRHVQDALDGSDRDDETGTYHEASIAACAGIILDGLMTGNIVDDRYKTGKVAGLLKWAARRSGEIQKEFAQKQHGERRRRRR